MGDSLSKKSRVPATHKKIKGAPDYDDAAYWDTKFMTGQDVGEWLNEGDLLIERAIAALEIIYAPIFDHGDSTKTEDLHTPSVLHLGPGISAVGSKLCKEFGQRGWKGNNILVCLLIYPLYLRLREYRLCTIKADVQTPVSECGLFL